MDDLLGQFLIEGRELVEQASEDLLELERRPAASEVVDSAFRAFHTLKGSTGLFDLAPLGAILHAAEDLLGLLRDGRATADASVLDALMACLRQTERWLNAIEADGGLPADAPQAAAALAARLRATQEESAPQALSTNAVGPAEWTRALLEPPLDGAGPFVAVRYTPPAEAYFHGDDPLAIARSAPGLARLVAGPREPWGPLEDYDPFACNLVLTALYDAPLAEVRAAFRFVADQAEFSEVANTAGAEEVVQPTFGGGGQRTLRVEAERVDRLAAVVDELVVAKNALAHLAARASGAGAEIGFVRDLGAAQINLDRLIGRLHGSVTRIRLVPLSPLFRRFSRLVREMAGSLGKDVEFRLRGEDVEVDKAVVDGLFDPLLHLLRNALDHGVEPAAERQAAGKPARASLVLSARASGDQVLVEVSDDGRGLNPERIRKAAVQRGLVGPEAAASLSDADAIDLVFAPGFSTAAQVSEVSGRGVGMDAVRSAVSALGGRVSLQSHPGEGTVVQLSLPLSLVLTRIMVVEAAGERFGAPLDSIIETARIPADRLAPIRAGRAFVLRDQAIPVLPLAELLGLPSGPVDGELNVLIVQAGAEPVGVLVDAFGERLDAPLRATNGLLTGLPGVLGATLLGDGQVLMVLDLPELIG